MVRSALLLSVIALCATPALAGTYSCTNGARLLGGNRCSDGSIPVYHADTITPFAGSAHGQGGRAVPRGGGSIHVFTPEERARMNENDRRAAHDLAQTWTRGRGTLSPAQLNAIQNQRCLMMAAGNPDVRCVPR